MWNVLFFVIAWNVYRSDFTSVSLRLSRASFAVSYRTFSPPVEPILVYGHIQKYVASEKASG